MGEFSDSQGLSWSLIGMCSLVLEWKRERGLATFLSALSEAGRAFSAVTSVITTQSVAWGPATSTSWGLLEVQNSRRHPRPTGLGSAFSCLRDAWNMSSCLRSTHLGSVMCKSVSSASWAPTCEKGKGLSLPSLDISSGIWLRIQCDLCSVGAEGTVKARPPLELCNRLQNGRVGFSTCSALKRDSELPTRKVGIADISNTLNRILKLAEILRSNLAVMLLVKGLGVGGQ